MPRFLFRTWKYRAHVQLLCWNEVGSLGLEFSTIQFAMLARRLYEAIQMMHGLQFFVLENSNQYLSAGVFFKSSDVDLRGREIFF